MPRRRDSSLEERGEDPLVMALDVVVGEDGGAAAAARDSDERPAARYRSILAARRVILRPGVEDAAEAHEASREVQHRLVLIIPLRQASFGVEGDSADEFGERRVIGFDESPLAVFGERVAGGAGAQDLPLLDDVRRRDAFN